MNKRILIVEDEFIVADDLQLTLEHAQYEVCGIAGSVAEAKIMLERERPGLVLLDIHLKGEENGISLARELKEKNIAFVYVSANSNWKIFEEAKATDPYGFIIKPFREQDLFVTLEIAFYRQEHSSESRWRRENQIRTELTTLASLQKTWQEKLLSMATSLQNYISFDGFTGKFKKISEIHFRGFGLHRKAFDVYEFIGLSELAAVTGLPLEQITLLLDESPNEEAIRVHNGVEFLTMLGRNPLKAVSAKAFGFCSSLTFPIFGYLEYEFSITFFSREQQGYNQEQTQWLAGLRLAIAGVLASITEDAKTMEYSAGPDRIKREKSISREGFSGLIGNSSAFLHIMDLVTQISPLDTTVFLTGEKGTGKTKLASCVHDLSSRSTGPFILFNCSDLSLSGNPTGSVHTHLPSSGGAMSIFLEKILRAKGGTLFMKEVGTLAPELQLKLLKALQENEKISENEGKANATRVIISSSQSLETAVSLGKFRLDLYYRLSVFQIHLPPLRERKTDIQALVDFFSSRHAARIDLPTPIIGPRLREAMQNYSWPGNVGELSKFVKRIFLGPFGADNALPENLMDSWSNDPGGHSE